MELVWTVDGDFTSTKISSRDQEDLISSLNTVFHKIESEGIFKGNPISIFIDATNGVISISSRTLEVSNIVEIEVFELVEHLDDANKFDALVKNSISESVRISNLKNVTIEDELGNTVRL